ncbi:MAG TPA: cupin domain-containing protein [Frateuria sp.]|uniref:cupin domain-containing protein n=1 Tax=Frateuria sp. TaxID=2211372 RepID=UPI002DF452AD|nr:cupin domain-containing protein [Frateuria sp.]
MFYLIHLDYLRPLADVDRHIERHREFLARHYAAGHFLLSGRKEPRTGGVILATANTADEVSQWISEDPFSQAGVAAYTVIGWQPTMAADGQPWDRWLVDSTAAVAKGDAGGQGASVLAGGALSGEMTDVPDTTATPKVSLSNLKFTEAVHGERYAARISPLATLLGAKKLGYRVIELPPGKRAWPRHHHYVNEELFIVLAGSGAFRLGEKTIAVTEGDVVSAPAGGAETAHQFINDSNAPLRYIAISTMEVPDVMGYPDSGTFAVFAGSPPGGAKENRTFEHVGRLADTGDYWEEA